MRGSRKTSCDGLARKIRRPHKRQSHYGTRHSNDNETSSDAKSLCRDVEEPNKVLSRNRPERFGFILDGWKGLNC